MIDDEACITATWLTAATGRCWQDVEVTEIGCGRALLSRVFRVRDTSGATAVVKLATRDPVQLLTAAALHAYAREAAFYSAHPSGWPRSPRCDLVTADASGTRVTVVLEDLGAEGGFDQLIGLDVGQLGVVADSFAPLHSSTVDPRLVGATRRLDDARNVDLLALAVPPGVAAARTLEPASTAGAVGRFLDSFLGHAPTLLSELAAEGAPLHGDLRADNVMIVDDEVACVDFQMLASGSPFFDLAYLAGQSGDLTLDEHLGLVDRHRRSLARDGRRIDAARAMRHYRASLLVSLAYPVVLAASADAMTERARRVVSLMLRRVGTAIDRCGALGILEP